MIPLIQLIMGLLPILEWILGILGFVAQLVIGFITVFVLQFFFKVWEVATLRAVLELSLVLVLIKILD